MRSIQADKVEYYYIFCVFKGDKHAKGNPTAQTIASEKYQKKAGYMTKGFKLKGDVADRFAKACEKAGVSQAQQITKMMLEFIEEQGIEE